MHHAWGKPLARSPSHRPTSNRCWSSRVVRTTSSTTASSRLSSAMRSASLFCALKMTASVCCTRSDTPAVWSSSFPSPSDSSAVRLLSTSPTLDNWNQTGKYSTPRSEQATQRD